MLCWLRKRPAGSVFGQATDTVVQHALIQVQISKGCLSVVMSKLQEVSFLKAVEGPDYYYLLILTGKKNER